MTDIQALQVSLVLMAAWGNRGPGEVKVHWGLRDPSDQQEFKACQERMEQQGQQETEETRVCWDLLETLVLQVW